MTLAFDLSAVLVWQLASAAAAWCLGASRALWLRRMGVAFAVMGALSGFVAYATFLRWLMGLLGGFSAMRAWALLREPYKATWFARYGYLVGVADLRAVPRTAGVFAPKLFLRALGFLPLSLLGAAMARAAALNPGLGHWGAGLRVVGGALLIYCATEVLEPTLRGLYALAGFQIARMHEDPIVSRTLGEWWGQRWNRVVGRWLRDQCFTPMARRRRARLGLVLSFAVSALYHAWFTLAAIGVEGAARMGAFFVVQGALVMAESALRVGRWPRAAQHTWTLGWLLVTSPLFTAPLLRVMGL